MIRGGSSDKEVNELTVMPKGGTPSASVVITATPVG